MMPGKSPAGQAGSTDTAEQHAGLATYLTDYAQAQAAGRDIAFRKAIMVDYMSYVGPQDAVALADLKDAAAGRAARAIRYGKGGMVLHMLRQESGEAVFAEAMDDFFNRRQQEAAGWSDLQAVFEKYSAADLNGFLDQWLTRPDVPRLDVQHLGTREQDGQLLLTFQLVQKNDPPYRLAVPVTIKTTRGDLHQIVQTTETATPVEIPLAADPTAVVIDQDYQLMRQLTGAELPPTWSRFAGAVDKIAVLSSVGDPAVFAPFLGMLASLNVRIMPEAEVGNADLAGRALIFLGTDGPICRSLFAQTNHARTGFTMEARNNPLAPAQVAILISAHTQEEVGKAVPQLAHYDQYGLLSFEDGRLKEKAVPTMALGQIYPLAEPPRAIATDLSRTFAATVNNLLENRVIYIGESHTNYADHQLQLSIIRAIHGQDPRLAIGMEMFPKTGQAVLDDFIGGRLTEREFLKNSHYFNVWKFDYRLYRDILNFARRHRLPVVALNVEKEIVSKVFKEGGATALSNAEKEAIPADRDLAIQGYRHRLEKVFRFHPAQHQGPDLFPGFLQAQALWDETMAATAAAYLAGHPADRLIILAGKGHVVKDSGIPPRLSRRLPVAQAVVLNSDDQDSDPASSDYLFFSAAATLPPAPMLGVLLEEEQGQVVIKDLAPDGAAMAGGLKKNDILLAIDSEPVASVEDVKIIMLYKEQAEQVRIRLQRPHTLLPDEIREIAVALPKMRHPH